MDQRKIIHIDMDCFYAAVEIRDNPRLKGRPVAVGGHPSGRGVLTTANYEARKFGVRSAMPVKSALNLCPKLELVPVNFSKYKNESKKIKQIFRNYTDLIQPLSLDEAYLDVTSSTRHGGSATQLAKEIRQEIYNRTQLTASAGIAPNKFLAKVASDWKKPNGQFTIGPADVMEFLRELPVRKIPGVGKVTAAKLNKLGIFTCGDLQKMKIQEMEHKFGKWGLWLYDICRGVDHRSVSVGGERKSLSIERTFSKDLPNLQSCVEQLPRLMEELDNRLVNAKIDDRIRGLVLKLKFNDFQQTTFERSSLKTPCVKSYTEMLEEAYYRQDKPVRLIGLGVKLESESKKSKTSQLTFDIG